MLVIKVEVEENKWVESRSFIQSFGLIEDLVPIQYIIIAMIFQSENKNLTSKCQKDSDKIRILGTGVKVLVISSFYSH